MASMKIARKVFQSGNSNTITLPKKLTSTGAYVKIVFEGEIEDLRELRELEEQENELLKGMENNPPSRIWTGDFDAFLSENLSTSGAVV